VKIKNIEITINGRFLKTARLKEEWYEDLDNPNEFIQLLKATGGKPDIFTFWQRLPESKPKYNFQKKWESIAALPITNFDDWWKKQIDSKTRNLIRKADKKGVNIKICDFNNDFITGMVSIFNETPIRQGKPFWHFGKDYETVKREFSRSIYREDLIGAYFNEELIGFMMLANAGRFAITTQIISKIAHRDKSPNNALMAKAVEICEKKKIPYLVYAMWDDGSLGDFKRNNGFERISLPRYYIPLTVKGKIILKMKLDQGFANILPKKLVNRLKLIRKKWYLRN
jgi:hypothetical protein